MITSCIHTIENQPPFTATVQAKVLNHDFFLKETFLNAVELEKWLIKSYRDIYAVTLLRFIHQREQAYKHFKQPSLKYENSLFLLKYRLNSAKSIPLNDLVQRIIRSEEDLTNILPSELSSFRGWRKVVQSLIDQSYEINALVQRHQGGQKARAPQPVPQNQYQPKYSTN